MLGRTRSTSEKSTPSPTFAAWWQTASQPRTASSMRSRSPTACSGAPVETSRRAARGARRARASRRRRPRGRPSSSCSTTWEPMKPHPPVTRTLMPRRACGQPEREPGAAVLVADGELAVVRVDEPLGDREPEPGARPVCARRIALVADVEDAVEVGSRNAAAAVAHRDEHACRAGSSSTPASTTTLPSLGVCRIAFSSRLRSARSTSGARRLDLGRRTDHPAFEAHALRRGDGRAPGERVGDEVGERHGAELEPQRAGLGAAQLEQVVDERGEVVGLLPEPAVVAVDGLGIVDHAVLERLGHRPDARRAGSGGRGTPSRRARAATPRACAPGVGSRRGAAPSRRARRRGGAAPRGPRPARPDATRLAPSDAPGDLAERAAGVARRGRRATNEPATPTVPAASRTTSSADEVVARR